MHTRRAVSDPAAAQDLAAYAAGVAEMQARSQADPLDPLGWEYQSLIHGNTSNPPTRGAHTPTDFSMCQHGVWFFLPWHRMYLVQFERIIAAASGYADFALPYWDYDSLVGITMPPAFDDPTSALYDSTRNFRPPNAAPPPAWQQAPTFRRFGGPPGPAVHLGQEAGQLELNPHNFVHGIVGGNMASFQSPLDPLFWIHHCNIDRLWDVWAREPHHDHPVDPAFGNTAFSFPDPIEPGGRRTLTVAEVLDTTAIDYVYDDRPGEPGPTPHSIVGMAGGRGDDDELQVLSSSDSPGGVRDSVQLAAPEPVPGLTATPGSGSLFLALENVGIESGDASSMWHVYVTSNRSGTRHLVGTISPFGLAQATATGGRDSYLFDVTEITEDIEGADLDISFEPVYDDVTAEPFWDRVALYRGG